MGRLVDENDVYSVLTEYYHHKTATQHMVLADALSTVKTADAIPCEWIKAQIPDSKEFYAVVTSIILYQLIDKYQREQM